MGFFNEEGFAYLALSQVEPCVSHDWHGPTSLKGFAVGAGGVCRVVTFKFPEWRRSTFDFRIEVAHRSGAILCYPLFATTRSDSYRSQRLEIADFVRTIIPMPIRIANSGITTAGVPIVLIASERK